MIIVLIITNLLILLTWWIIWRAYYKRHERYHFGNRAVNLVGRLLGHRQLFVLYLLHVIVLLAITNLLIIYVW